MSPYNGWYIHNGVFCPPVEWKRGLAIDVGGTSPWSWLWCAIDPDQNVIVYHEIYRPGTDIAWFVDQAAPFMLRPDGEPLSFDFKCIDAAGKIAADDIRRRGIQLTNAIKVDKLSSIHRLAGYLHVNPKHAIPAWHPLSGRVGSPRLFITSNCKGLLAELPQQRWRQTNGLSIKDEPDPTIADHSVDALLYALRQLPPPYELKPAKPVTVDNSLSLMSRLYYADRERQEKLRSPEGRKPYRISRMPFSGLN